MPASPSNAGPSQFNPPQFGGPEVHPEFGYFAPTVRFRRKFVLVLEGVACGVLVGAVAMFFATMEREEGKASAMLAMPMLVAPTPSAAPPAATPSSPTASTPTAFGSAAASTSPAPGSVRAAPASSTPTVSKPRSPTPASAASAPQQTAAAGHLAPVRFVPESIALPAAAPRLAPAASDTPPGVTVSASASVSAPAISAAELPPTLPVIAAAPAPATEIKAVVAKPKRKIVREPQSERSARQVPREPDPRSAYAGPRPPPAFLRPLFGFGF